MSDSEKKGITPGRVWSPPQGAMCQKCEAPIAFKQLASGKWCPVEPDGKDHFDKCRERSIRLGLRPRGPDQQNFGVSKRKDTSVPMWDGIGVPWADDPPDTHDCGRPWVSRQPRGLSVLLVCACRSVRIETSYVS